MNPTPPSQNHQSSFPKHSLLLLLIPLILLHYFNPSLPLFNQSLPQSPTFLPLKDMRLYHNPHANNTWFLSSLRDSPGSRGNPSFLLLPSPSSHNRLLCLSAANPRNGSLNSYALSPPQSLPRNATLLPNLTFVSETFYDYANPWHGLAAIVPFAQWREGHNCAKAERWVLFHWGEVRKEMGVWVRALAEVAVGGEVRVAEGAGEGRVVCLERAVVVRRNDEGMSGEMRGRVYDLMRCRARDYCDLGRRKKEDASRVRVRVTLLFRVGGRGFKNETAVGEVFGRECGRVEGCSVRVVRVGNWTFCDQVSLFFFLMFIFWAS